MTLSIAKFRFIVVCILLVNPSLYADWREELKSKISQGQFPHWMKEQIDDDLAPFKDQGITESNIWKTIGEHPGTGFILCQITDNRFTWLCTPLSERQDFRVKM